MSELFRQLKNRLQQQADKIKELEADWLDEHTKCQLMGKEIEKLNRIINFIQRGMEGNEQFEKLLKDLEGGYEEKTVSVSDEEVNKIIQRAEFIGNIKSSTL